MKIPFEERQPTLDELQERPPTHEELQALLAEIRKREGLDLAAVDRLQVAERYDLAELVDFLGAVVHVADVGLEPGLPDADQFRMLICQISLARVRDHAVAGTLPDNPDALLALLGPAIEAAFYVGATCGTSEGATKLSGRIANTERGSKGGSTRSPAERKLDEIVSRILLSGEHDQYLDTLRKGVRARGENVFVRDVLADRDLPEAFKKKRITKKGETETVDHSRSVKNAAKRFAAQHLN